MIRHSLSMVGLAAGVAVAIGIGPQMLGAQRPAADASPRTPWGDPDLQGTWTNTTTTPLERLPEAGGKDVLSEEERARVARQVFERIDQDKPRPGTVVPYNEFWYERGTLSNRTSLIVDPPSGRLPPFTASGQRRWDGLQAIRREGRADSWLDRGAYDRCITRGMPGAMMPGFYNHNYQIAQSPGVVLVLVEMIHDARIIPVDGRPHLSGAIRQWLGDPRGRWQGPTLVVETTNLNDKVFERAAAYGFGGNMRMTERFTRTGPTRIDYQFTIDDPTTFTAPWTVSAPMEATDGPLYEYACHEGNYAMGGILAGARAAEHRPPPGVGR